MLKNKRTDETDGCSPKVCNSGIVYHGEKKRF